MILQANGSQKKADVAILTTDRIDLKPKKKVMSDKDGHYIMIKGTVQQKDIIVSHIYTPNIGAPKYIKQLLTDLKGEIDAAQ